MGGRIGALHSTSLGVKIPLMICVPPCVCVSCREMLLQVVSGSQLVVCYKAKDLLRTALQHYRPDLHWKQCNFDKAVKNSLQLSSVGIWDYNIILLCSFPPQSHLVASRTPRLQPGCWTQLTPLPASPTCSPNTVGHPSELPHLPWGQGRSVAPNNTTSLSGTPAINSAIEAEDTTNPGPEYRYGVQALFPAQHHHT